MKLCIISALLAAVGAAATATPTAQLNATGNLSQYGVEIFTGMIEAFLHSDNLTKAELHCLVNEAGDAAFQAYESSSTTATLLRKLARENIDEPLGPQPAEVGLLAVQLAENVHVLVSLSTIPFAHCVAGRKVPASIEVAARHLRNMRYIEGNLLANGADIMMELTAATDAFMHHQYRTFGRDVGRACRKALLAGGDAKALPEGPPSMGELVNMSAGVIEGFFGPGFEIVVEPSRQVVTGPLIRPLEGNVSVETVVRPGRADAGEEVLHIDLHACVEKNLGFFQEVLAGVWFFFAQKDTAGGLDGEMTDGAYLMPLLAGLPEALRSCDLGAEQEQMLAESLLTFGRAHFEPDAAGALAQTTPEVLLGELKHACKDWSDKRWLAFGRDLGEMLRRIVTEVFPRLYSVDARGRLRRQVLLVETTARLPLIAVAASLLLSAALIMRRGKRVWRVPQPVPQANGAEDADVESNLLVE